MSVTFPFFSLDRSPSDRSRDAAWGVPSLTLALVLVGSVAGCATKADVRDLQDEIRELYSQQQVLLQELQESQRAHQDSISVVARSLQDGRAETARRMTSIEDQLLTSAHSRGSIAHNLAILNHDACDLVAASHLEHLPHLHMSVNYLFDLVTNRC